MHGKATNGGRDAAATVKFSKRAAGCLGGTVREGEGMLSSAMQVSWQRTLDTLRPAAACAEAVAMKVRNLVLSKKGGICCYSTQCGSADVSGYPVAEGQPAIRPLPPSGPEPFCALRAAGFHSNFLVFGPRTGLFPEILSMHVGGHSRTQNRGTRE